MRVLVTGNLGYIGPVIVRRLRQAGHHVTGVDTGWYVSNYAGEPVWPHVQHFRDIRNPGYAWSAVDAVVHLAGLSNDPMSDLDPGLTGDINLAGTLGMLDSRARNVIVSSCSVYGSTKEMATEETKPNPLTPYAQAKADVDRYVHRDGDDYFDAVSLRLGTIYGYSPGHRLDLVVNRMVHDALNKGYVTATGNAARPLVHVEDVASAVLFMLTRQETGIYNVVGENTRMYPLADGVASFAGVPRIYGNGGNDARDYAASGDKLRALGWESQHTVLGSLPVLFERTMALPKGRTYERLPILRAILESKAA